MKVSVYWSAATLARRLSYFFFSFSRHSSIFIFLKASVDTKAKALRCSYPLALVPPSESRIIGVL